MAGWVAFEDLFAVAGEFGCWPSGHGLTLQYLVFVASALASLRLLSECVNSLWLVSLPPFVLCLHRSPFESM